MRLIRIVFIAFIAFSLLSSVILPYSQVHADGDGTEYWAVIVGISNYYYQDNLLYEAINTRALYQQLVPIWGTDHIALITDYSATKSAIQNSIQNWLAPCVDSDDVVLFYFAGHGGTDGSSYYIAPTDSSIYTWADDISVYELSNWLSGLKSNNIIVILDACESGGFITDLSSISQVIMASSTASESSLSNRFTYYLVQTLGNANAADNNADHTLTTQEIFAYTSPRVTQFVAQQWGESQHPVNYDSYPGGLPLFMIAAIGSNVASGSISVDGMSYSNQNFPYSLLMTPNSSHSVTVPSQIDNGTSRYAFLSWNDGPTAPTRTISQGGQYTANYKIQYCFIFAKQGLGTDTEWYDSGTTASTDTAQEIITNGSTRYIFQHWSIDGVVVSENPVTVYMNESHFAYANYGTQFYLSVSSEHGSVSGADWYYYGATASTGVAQATITDGNTRYIFQHWDVDGIAKTGNPITISMNAPHTATAEYKTQYYMDVQSKYGVPSGEGWYDSDTAAQVSVTPVVGTLIRHKFNGWSGDSNDDYSSTSVYMNQPKSIVATWKTDYLYLYLLIGGVIVVIVAIIVPAIVHVRNKRN